MPEQGSPVVCVLGVRDRTQDTDTDRGTGNRAQGDSYAEKCTGKTMQITQQKSLFNYF